MKNVPDSQLHYSFYYSFQVYCLLKKKNMFGNMSGLKTVRANITNLGFESTFMRFDPSLRKSKYNKPELSQQILNYIYYLLPMYIPYLFRDMVLEPSKESVSLGQEFVIEN